MAAIETEFMAFTSVPIAGIEATTWQCRWLPVNVSTRVETTVGVPAGAVAVNLGIAPGGDVDFCPTAAPLPTGPPVPRLADLLDTINSLSCDVRRLAKAATQAAAGAWRAADGPL